MAARLDAGFVFELVIGKRDGEFAVLHVFDDESRDDLAFDGVVAGEAQALISDLS